ncbi:MAG: tripartite tricarboxylate transporter TctB family protein, partial [Firmicutes bacterium]|nr:tripartite tricarboxylate transporter TctB family protein [Bacillota bacterium]
SDMGAVFPNIIIAILAGLSVIQLIQSFTKKEVKPAFEGVEARRVLSMALGIVGYVIVMMFAGFLISSVLFLGVFFKVLDNTKKVTVFKSAALACVLTAIFYGVFHYAFHVPLPVGIIFGG